MSDGPFHHQARPKPGRESARRRYALLTVLRAPGRRVFRQCRFPTAGLKTSLAGWLALVSRRTLRVSGRPGCDFVDIVFVDVWNDVVAAGRRATFVRLLTSFFGCRPGFCLAVWRGGTL